jgi:hypothetical protein
LDVAAKWDFFGATVFEAVMLQKKESPTPVFFAIQVVRFFVCLFLINE